MNIALRAFIQPVDAPLSARISRARESFSSMFDAGELDALPEDTRCALRGLELFLATASDDAKILEDELWLELHP